MRKHLVSIKDLNVKEINKIFSLASKIKKKKSRFSTALERKTLGLLFQKPSNRTRVSFDVGMHQLGGCCTYLGPQEINLGVRETTKDVSLTLSRYLDGVVLRTYAHNDLLEFAKYSTIPVINGLTDLLHPCQALADLFTINEKLKKLKGTNLAYIGDGNNVCHSLLYACSQLGVNLKIATPVNYQPKAQIIEEAKELAVKSKASISLNNNDPKKAAKDADVIYADVWTSMGQEAEQEKRIKDFADFQVNKKLVSLAREDCLIMHCLPAHRGQEITDQVIDGKNSIVFDQAENRLHVQKAILVLLLGGKL